MPFIKKLIKKGLKYPFVRQASLGIVFNFFSVLFSVITVSFLIKFLGKNDYGIWLTIFSICNWISFLDGGFGNGLRNELTGHLVNKNKANARAVISTGYISIFLFLCCLYALLVGSHLFIDWNTVVGSSAIDFNLLALFVFGFFILQMVLKIIGKIYFAFNRSYLSFLIPMLSNLGILLLIMWSYYSNVDNKFWNIAYIYALTPLVVLLIMSAHFFLVLKPEYAPAFKLFNKKYVSSIIKNGSLFFLIQMGTGLLQAITPLFITQWFSPVLTAEYLVAVKYYSFLLILLNILLQTMWDSIAQVYLKRNMQVLKRIVKYKVLLTISFLIVIGFMYLISSWVFKVWLGEDILVSKTINLAAFAFVVVVIISRVFTNFLNATTNIKLQSLISVIILVLFIPVAYLFVKVYDLGIVSLILTPALFYLVQMLFAVHETRKILKNKTPLKA